MPEVNVSTSELMPASFHVPPSLVKAPPPALNVPVHQSATAQQRNILGRQFVKAGRYAEAIEEFQKAASLSPRDRQILRDLAYGHAISGKRAEALTMLKAIQDNYEKHEALGLDIAAVYAGLGENDQAFVWLEKDFQRHGAVLPSVAYWSWFDSLRGDSRYADLLRRMALKP